jgi:hypothetical protein
MYSFVLRAHQKIDKVAYRHLSDLTDCSKYFTFREVVHFEGRRGPDSPKLKKGGGQPPWHFYDPDGKNEEYLRVIKANYDALVKEIKLGDSKRSGFEAAWLAHALVDGLTPAHHYPYEEKLREIRSEDKSTSTNPTSHAIVRGDNFRDTVRKTSQLKGGNFRDSLRKGSQLIGPKGLLTTHTTFEAGAATIILPLLLMRATLSEEVLSRAKDFNSLAGSFKSYVSEIDALHMHDRFYKKGWTPALALDVRREIAPRMVKIVTLAWYCALKEANKLSSEK